MKFVLSFRLDSEYVVKQGDKTMPDEGNVVNNPAEETAILDSTTEDPNDIELTLEPEEASTTSKGKDEGNAEQDTETEDEAGNEDQPESDETETTEKQSKGEQRKDQLNQEIRDLVAQRNEIRRQVEQTNNQAYQTPTVDQLLEQVNPDTGDYYNRLEAQIETMKQGQALRDYNDQVSETRLVLTNEAQKALTDFPIFDESSPEYNPTIAANVDAILGNSIIRDPRTGDVIGSNLSPYQLYKTVYESTQLGATQGQVAAQKAQSQMLANSDSITSAASTKKTQDPVMKVLLEGLDD